MKVFYLTNIPSPYRVKFFNELGKKCDLTVVFEAYNEKNRSWQASQVGDNFKAIFLPGMSFLTQFHYNPSIKRHLRQYSYDVYVISGYNSPTDMLAINELTKQKKPFIFSADGGFPNKNDFSIKADIKRHFISAGTWFMSSGSVCDEYLMCYGAKQEDIYRYNLTSITEADLLDDTLLTPVRRKALLEKYGLKDKVVITAGQFIERKGFDLLLGMWGHVKSDDASLIIVGGGPKKKQYQRIIKEQNLKNVVLQDFIPKERLFELYRISRVFVFPTRYDIWGMTPGEAMCCALPVITSPNAASSFDLIEDGYNGFVEELIAPVAWARHMEELLKDDEKYELFGKRSYNKIKDYTIEKMSESYYELFKKIMKENQEESAQ